MSIKQLLHINDILFSDSIRSDFPILQRKLTRTKSSMGEPVNLDHTIPLVFLDNASTTHKPASVIQSIIDFYQFYNSNVHRGLYDLAAESSDAYEKVRRLVQKYIHAASEKEIIFTHGTTDSINLLATSWGKTFLKPGDRILLTEMEHHSNLVPWQMIAKETQASLTFIPITSQGTLDLDFMLRHWDDRIRLVSVIHQSNVFGTINDIAKIIEVAHQHDVPVCIDAAQSITHLPIDVMDLDCDFLAFSAHKMCGPTGVGVLYAKEKWLEKMPPYQGGGDMISSVWLDRASWNEIPYKFEAGTPNIAGVIGFGAAIEYLMYVGLEKIQHYIHTLSDYMYELLKTVDHLHIYGCNSLSESIASFNLDHTHAHDASQFLNQKGIAVRAGHHCAHPIMRKLNVPSTLRASVYFYNTKAEIDSMIKALIEAQEFFK